MTPAQRLASVLIVGQLLAVFVGALPAPEEFPDDVTLRPAGYGLRAGLTHVLDLSVGPVVRLHRLVWNLTRPLHAPFGFYLNATGQFEKWNMFSAPLRGSEYVALRCFYRRPDGTVAVERVLVFPAHTPSWDVMDSYRSSFVDKAFANALDRYEREWFGVDPQARPPLVQVTEHVTPFIRHYGARRAPTTGPAVGPFRIEFWRGLATTPESPGGFPPGTLEQRRTLLERLREGLVENARRVSPQPIGAREHEADIDWQLWAVDDLR